MSIEAAIIGVAAAAVKSAAKLWLADKAVAADAASNAIDVAASRLTTELSQRRLRRFYDEMTDAVTERLQPLLDREFRDVPEHERLAAITAVRETFALAKLDDDDLFKADLNAAYLDRHLRDRVPDRTRDLSDGATRLYGLLLRELCLCTIEIARRMPQFGPQALTELLERTTQIIADIRLVLERMPARTSDSGFEHDYRLYAMRRLDKIQMYGTLPGGSQTYPLSTAYVSLTATWDGTRVDRIVTTAGDPHIEVVLSKARRVLIKAQAGLGKTTLLQWIAVRSARGDFGPPLADWNDCVPLFIPLREYADKDLPDAGAAVRGLGKHIAEEMPQGWAHQQLRRGRGLVLIDGVDELPEGRREAAFAWLQELIEDCPESRYIVTSRPPGVAEHWLDELDFETVELAPMGRADIKEFVHRWFEAMRQRSPDREALDELTLQENGLLDLIESRYHLGRLARFPMMCSLICALYRDRRQRIPENRMELYRIALEMLLTRRDAERDIAELEGLTPTAKTMLLGDIAYWMLQNNLSAARTTDVEQRIQHSLGSLPLHNVDAHRVYRHLLERTGLLREPSRDNTDFVHKTFQEHLAGLAAVQNNDIRALVQHADSDNWHEVVVAAAGHCPVHQREYLLDELVKRARSEHLDSLLLLAAACVEVAPEGVPKHKRDAILRNVESLVPPQDMEAARRLAVGPFVIDLLARSDPATPEEIAASVHAAAMIGGDDAMQFLSRYVDNEADVVRRELIVAWRDFDPVEYAHAILRDMDIRELSLPDETYLPALGYLQRIESLGYVVPPGGDLSFVPATVRRLDLRLRSGVDLSQLSAADSLESIAAIGVGTMASIAISSWQALPQGLRSLEITGCGVAVPSEEPPRPLALDRLDLGEMEAGDLPPFPRGITVAELRLHRIAGLASLQPLSHLAGVRVFSVRRCPGLSDVSILARWRHSLERVTFEDCGEFRVDVLAGMPGLQHIDLMGRGDRPLTVDLSPLRHMAHRVTLTLAGYSLVDLSPLAPANLVSVTVAGSGDVTGNERLGDRFERAR